MPEFPEPPSDDYEMVYLNVTDQDLPEKISQSTRYAYFKTIAKGGKAIVQSCKDLHLSRIVCYKKLRPEFADDPIEQKRFLREARVSAMLQHPNTIPMYELSRDRDGHYFFTMKLVHGYTLREVLDYRERYDFKTLINVLIQISHALEYAHSHHVIHRDIKPENILVGPYGEILLMDWGLAKVWNQDGSNEDLPEIKKPIAKSNQKVSSMSDLDNLQGTISYMSPEQIKRDPNIDFRTDIYSMGVILYEILSGRLPTTAETVDGVIEQILNETPEKPSALTKKHVPRLLETIAMSCISKSVDGRLQSCGELIRLLEEDWS